MTGVGCSSERAMGGSTPVQSPELPASTWLESINLLKEEDPLLETSSRTSFDKELPMGSWELFSLLQGLSERTPRVTFAHTQRGVRNRRHSREKGRTWSEGEIEKRKREIEKKPSDCEELQPRIATIATIVTKGKIEKRNCKGKGVQVCR